MIPARDASSSVSARPAVVPSAHRGTPAVPLPAVALAELTTLSGAELARGVCELRGSADAWAATLRRLDRPGVVANAYFARGVREVLLRLADGRAARAHLANTAFVEGTDRVFELRGLEPLARS
jgi:hypothetical protein